MGLALPADIQLQSQRAVTTVAAELWGQTGATLPHHVTQMPLILLLETSPPLHVCVTHGLHTVLRADVTKCTCM